MSFYERYAECCKEKGIQPASQWAADQLGCSRGNISSLARRGNVPRGDVVANAAKMLNVSADYLLGIIDEPKRLEPVYTPDREIKKQIATLNSEGKDAAIAVISGLAKSEKYSKERKIMKVKLQDIVDAMYMANQESDNYLDLETGEIVWISEMAMSLKEQQELSDQLDEHGCVQLPSSYDIGDYDILTDFIETLPEDAQDKLWTQVQGRGAFSRFKNAIIQLGLDQDWYAFKEDAYRKIAAEWCEDNGIEYE